MGYRLLYSMIGDLRVFATAPCDRKRQIDGPGGFPEASQLGASGVLGSRGAQ